MYNLYGQVCLRFRVCNPFFTYKMVERFFKNLKFGVVDLLEIKKVQQHQINDKLDNPGRTVNSRFKKVNFSFLKLRVV